MIELNYSDLVQEIEDFLKNTTEVVVATCADNLVTGRTMNPVNDGLTLMVGTKSNSTKVMQMRQNSNVALICGPIQIEATAVLGGTSEEKTLHTKLNDEKYPWMKNSFPKDVEEKNEDILAIFHPKKITFYKYLDNNAHWDVLDVRNRKAYRI